MSQTDPTPRITTSSPSSAPVPFVALQQRAAQTLPVDRDELRRRRRRLVRLTAALLVAAATSVGVSAFLLRSPNEQRPMATPVPHGIPVHVDINVDDDLASARRKALLQLAQDQPDALPLLSAVPDTVDNLLAGRTILDEERISLDPTGDERRRMFEAYVDADRLNQMLCERIDEEYAPSVAIAIFELGTPTDIASDLAKAFGKTCVKASVISVDEDDAQHTLADMIHPRADAAYREARSLGADFVVDGTLKSKPGDPSVVHGALRLRSVAHNELIETHSARASADVDEVVNVWRDAFTKEIARRWFPSTLTIKITNVDDRRFDALQSLLPQQPFVARVKSKDLDADDVAKFSVVTFGDHFHAGEKLNGIDVDGRRLEVVEAYQWFVNARLVDAP